MKLKVATWNMGHCMHRSAAQQAWNYLDSDIAADITLVQESVPPIERQKEFCVWREIGGKRKWGSGVLTKGLPVTEIKLDRNDYLGALTVADVTLPDDSTLVVVSLYGQMEHGYSITTLHRILSDLTLLFEGELRRGGRPKVILGGDLNASPQFDDEYGLKTHRIFFQRLEAFGLMDCQGQFTKDRQRTLRHSKSDIPWVNDYIFASKTLAKKVVAHKVVEQPEMLNLSDHNPVVVTFDL
jgi:endonuclease/exonuclease/phosphatase family metal-dependent hydrolase